MAAFKDKKNGSWYVQFRYTDWRGERQQKLKRGFATKKEAQAWEREFLMQKQADVNMSFESFVALYEKDVKPKLKLNTWLSKEHIIRTKILPYFKKRKLSEITARDVIDWQNEIRQHTKSSGESYSPDYLKNVHTQLSCIFNHAIKYYGLQINPAAKAGNMGSEQPKEMLFWTKEEYLKFIDAMMDKPMLYYAFEILYWCGICPLPKVTLKMITADLILSLAMVLNRRPRKITSSRKPTQSMHAMRQAVSAGE